MDIDQLKSNWQQKLTQAPKTETLDWDKNLMAIESKMKTLDRNVNSRTLYGTIMFTLILVSMIALGYFSYLLGKLTLMSALGLTSWIVLMIVTMTRIFIVKRQFSLNDNTLTILESLRHKLAKVDSEIEFYLSLFYKVLIPMSPGIILLALGSNASLQASAGFMACFILCCYFSYRYNKHYVTKNLTPIKEELIANLKALSQNND